MRPPRACGQFLRRCRTPIDLQLGQAFDEERWTGLSILLQVNNLTSAPDTTQQITGLPYDAQVAPPLEYDTWGRTVMFGVNSKL